jgi:transcriptional regulator with XRE-family HTH domain
MPFAARLDPCYIRQMHMPDMHTSWWDAGGVESPIPVGGVVRALRLARGFDQVPFAEALGISQGHLSKIERGQGKLGIDAWSKGAKALAVGAPREIDPAEKRFEGDQPLFVLTLPMTSSGHPGALRLLAGEDGRARVFFDGYSALFAAAVFERLCAPEPCVIPVWEDFLSHVVARSRRPVVVPTPQPAGELDVSQVRLDELEAAATIARAWLQEAKVRHAEIRKTRDASDFNKAITAVGRKLGRKWSPPAHLPADSLAITDAAEKETLWPPMD